MAFEQKFDALEARQQFERELVDRCWKDGEFRKALLADPKKIVEQLLGQTLPEWFTVRVEEEGPAAFCMVLPAKPQTQTELSQQELVGVVGGGTAKTTEYPTESISLNYGAIKWTYTQNAS